jgi:hypothetical protein
VTNDALISRERRDSVVAAAGRRPAVVIAGRHQWSGTPVAGRLTRELQRCSIKEHHDHCS